jgi:uncharacterized protein YecT (DUF1311 family)
MKPTMMCIALAAMLMPCALAHADDKEPTFSTTYNQCMDAASGITSSMISCTGDEHDKQDARLNLTYKTLMGRLSPAQQVKLRVLERTWIKRTKTRCDRAGDGAAGGSMQPLIIYDCYLQETTKHADFLEHYRP